MTIMQLTGLAVLISACLVAFALALLPGPDDPPRRFASGPLSLGIAIVALFVSGVLFGITVGVAHAKRNQGSRVQGAGAASHDGAPVSSTGARGIRGQPGPGRRRMTANWNICWTGGQRPSNSR